MSMLPKLFGYQHFFKYLLLCSAGKKNKKQKQKNNQTSLEQHEGGVNDPFKSSKERHRTS